MIFPRTLCGLLHLSVHDSRAWGCHHHWNASWRGGRNAAGEVPAAWRSRPPRYRWAWRAGADDPCVLGRFERMEISPWDVWVRESSRFGTTSAEGFSDFYEWHDREHIPERVDIDGFQRGRRYISVAGAPRFFTLYNVRDPSVMKGSPITAASMLRPPGHSVPLPISAPRRIAL